MSISIVTPPSPREHDGPPDYWSGLARCPSVAAVTPLKNRGPREYEGNRRNGGNGNCCNPKMMLLSIGLLCCLLVIGILYTRRNDIYGENGGNRAINGQNITKQKNRSWDKWLQKIDYSNQKEPQYEKFIFTEPMEGPLANQMYRFASLYAMGQFLNRTPVFVHNDATIRGMEDELEGFFPHFHEKIYFLRSDFEEYEKVKMAEDCCDYHDPKKLLAKNEARGLMLTGAPNFENYRYFSGIRPQILRLFDFNSKMALKVAGIKKRMLKNDKMHKICVHTRIGNLEAFGELKTFEMPKAVERVVQMLPKFKTKPTNKYSVLLIGEGKDYEQSIKIGDQAKLNKVYHVVEEEMTEEEELCFGLLACDSLLLTDSLSPYAFWMAYLMPEDRPIFYVRKQIELPTTKLDSLELLPSDWLAIEEQWLKGD